MLQITNLKNLYLLLKKHKVLICYLKNLKGQSITNVTLKGHMNAFRLIYISQKVWENKLIDGRMRKF
jgi:hypothetical protein